MDVGDILFAVVIGLLLLLMLICIIAFAKIVWDDLFKK